MKSKELIEKLLKLDPSGEVEVCVSNIDIDDVQTEPAYYDGPLQVLVKDNDGNITGAKYKAEGSKINLSTLPISDAVIYNYNLNIDYSELNEVAKNLLKNRHNDRINWHKNLKKELEFDEFLLWVKSKLDVDEEPAMTRSRAMHFFENNLSPTDPIIVEIGESYVMARRRQWDEKYCVGFVDGFLRISEKI